MGLPPRADLVLRSGLEIAGVISFVQLFFERPADAIDHSPALDGRALADFFRPARQVFIFVRLQELARVVVFPSAYPTNLFPQPAPEPHREYFEIHPIEFPPNPDDLLRGSFGHLEFKLNGDGRVLIKPDCRPNIPEAIDLDDITESLGEEIASELLIEVLNTY
jgi:hypothetical protein